MSGIPPPHPPTRVLFVGNIPYELTEEQVLDVLNPIAPVQRFNLIADKNAPAAGRSKGYGFAEYSDIDTATFALQKIVQIHLGSRALRAAYSEDRSAPGGGTNNNFVTSTPPPLLTATNAVSQNLASFEPDQLLDALQNFKQLVATNRQQAHEVLKNAPPQLTHALVQSMLLMGFIDTNVISKAVPVVSPTPAATMPGLPPNHALIVKQVLDLSDDQINSLPIDQRTTLLQLRDNYRRGIF
ncbi:hypothetical protein NADFUDRAFT_27919 [Nadsonia fulvescens var. elongata DSM 6958]|uniref:RRM domain-containing protein n=1 Tax=Nadsonia fulvescens var. elongata DSM 6958 TaxID=857566 RepID=A0A1E3PEK9_9ASCO|nr:hypothetical protein NADFUDRAFT_27919 [Nadsonia fulvescens var. elongata DSM 6958]